MSLDKAQTYLRGRIGVNPEMFNGGCHISVGKNRKSNQPGSQNGEVTDWFTVKFFNRGNFTLGDWAAQQLRKGMRVYITGDLVIEKFTPQGASSPVTRAVIYASDFDILCNRKQIEESVRAADHVASGGMYGEHGLANAVPQQQPHYPNAPAPQQNNFQAPAPQPAAGNPADFQPDYSLSRPSQC